jgi:hypothetical protein
MKFQIGNHEIPVFNGDIETHSNKSFYLDDVVDILVEYDNGKYELSFGDFSGDDESWTPAFLFDKKSKALQVGYEVFEKINDEEKLFVVLDSVKNPTQEMETFDVHEMEYIKDLIQEEIDNGN